MKVKINNKASACGYGANQSRYGSGCTQAIMTGITALEGNMNGQCVDSPEGW